MNKTAIKNYATWARRELIRHVSQKAFEYGIDEDGIAEMSSGVIGDRVLTQQEQNQRKELVRQIKSKGYTQVMEEVAYTWFNRFIALRFMEVNGYLPSKTRVFSNEENEFAPQIIKDALEVDIDGLDKNRIIELLEKQQTEELFKYLIITQCNALGACLPGMFETIENYTELLFPDNILKEDSVVGKLVIDIPEEDWQDQVQIIGWLYQYYNAEYKDETFALLKKNVKITKERIPSATQLFTPDWIVRYMVENSLGRLWIEGHPNDSLKENWKYYLDEADQEPEVETELAKIREEHSKLRPEDIKVIDPCMGSGHILVYAFDVLMQIYESQGYTQRDAATAIIENNIYGLDIDDRAAQLAYFAVMMKARQYDRRILTRGIQPHTQAIIESNNLEYLPVKMGQMSLDESIIEDINYVIRTFKDAKEYGSILEVEDRNYQRALEYIAEIKERGADDLIMQGFINSMSKVLPQLLHQAELFSQKYDVVITNPPYMGSSGMSAKLSEYVKKNYPDSKSDLFAVFMERCSNMIANNAYQAMITQHAWMFLGSYENLRKKLLNLDTVNMAHLGARAFDEIGGEVVQTTSFVLQKSNNKSRLGTYCRLIEPTSEQGKEDMFLAKKNRYTARKDNFSKIPGAPIAYWVSEKFVVAFDKGIGINSISDYTASQNKTADNEKYLRCCWEIENYKRWKTYSKGGSFRRWYGNLTYLVDWSHEAIQHYRNNPTSNLLPERYWDSPGIAYTDITSGLPSFRYFPGGAFDMSGPVIVNVQDKEFCLAVLNSKVFDYYKNIVNPTIHCQAKDVKIFPIIGMKSDIANEISFDVKCNIRYSRDDWDAYETSWDFKTHSLV